MTAYKVYLKILLKNLWLIIMYAVILGTCSVMNMKTSSGSVNYSADKPAETREIKPEDTCFQII